MCLLTLGFAYKKGHGVPQNSVKAVRWYRKAAEQGYATAQSNLGAAYANGQGVPQNYVEAVSWFRKAAEQGNADAQANLGLAYIRGQGVPQNSVEAVSWFRKAAEQGNALAQLNLRLAYRRDCNYTLYNLSVINDSSSTNNSANNRKTLDKGGLTPELEAAQSLTLAISQPSNPLKALDQYVPACAQ